MRFLHRNATVRSLPGPFAYNGAESKRKSKKRNGGGGSGNGLAKSASFTREATALRERIMRALSQTEDRAVKLRESLGLAEATIAQLGEGS